MSVLNPEIKIKPDILKWARETIGFDVPTAAKKISVKPEVVLEWEQTEQEISIPRLRKIANTYKRSLGLFLLPSAPKVSAFPPDFRTLDSTKADTLSPETRIAIRKAQKNREFFVEILESLDQKQTPINLSFSLNDNPVKLANKFRSHLNINFETQAKWENKSEALKIWIDAVENFGILVFQMTLPIKELRAFCLRDHHLPPAVVLNTKDDIHARIFSLFHEVSHLLIKQSEIDQLTLKKGEKEAHKIVEWFANNFAGSFLVPEESLLNNPFAKKYLEGKSDYDLRRLKGQYKVSTEVILRRFLNIGSITEKEYKEKKAILDKEIEQYRKNQEQKKKEKAGFRSVSRESFQRAGVLLTNKTFTAIDKGKITNYDVSRFFEIKQSHISKIRNLLSGRGE